RQQIILRKDPSASRGVFLLGLMVSTEELHSVFLTSSGACTDTRQLLAGGMFFALKGPNFDANAFAAKALESGCAFAVVDDPTAVVDERYLLVPDVLRALQELGRYHRRRFHIPVVAITGTNGKTTTKELVHAVLSAYYPTLSTIGNLNNHIGVPLTLLRLTDQHRIAIIEMGANHIGDIADLVNIAEPTHALITNIGRAHLEGFGSYEGVVKAKTELYEFIRQRGGVVFVNADDPLLMEKSEGLQRVTYGTTGEPYLMGGLEPADGPCLDCHMVHMDDHWVVHSQLIGAYNLPNVLAAACIGFYFDVPDERIIEALDNYLPTNNRSQLVDTGRNRVIMDAYNANPSSMAAALANFASLRTDRSKLAILGGMKELGAVSTEEHAALIALVISSDLDAIYVGPEFIEHRASGIRAFADAQEALKYITENPITGRMILVKGSRGTKLETLSPAL
ncbi:MAG: UDP-N-acetylmuramoyl-tripeptide--D-alanyl-D-alanine ligase, partial [Flavobacteriales bacterium]|nr:UDP-N-acetylmuramoyl-tripeptide--D-alanyl-D-alanine ligase [Flavobacteriales bacterium]